MVKVKSLLDPLPLNLDGVPDSSFFTKRIRSLGASPVFCEYQAKPSSPSLHLYTSVLVLQLILTVSSGPAAVVEGLWVTLICPLLSETQQEENQLKTLTIYLKKWIDIKLVLHKPWANAVRVQMKMMMKVMLMKIVVCVSDEVLNSQHYKHSQSTEASDQYAN